MNRKWSRLISALLSLALLLSPLPAGADDLLPDAAVEVEAATPDVGPVEVAPPVQSADPEPLPPEAPAQGEAEAPAEAPAAPTEVPAEPAAPAEDGEAPAEGELPGEVEATSEIAPEVTATAATAEEIAAQWVAGSGAMSQPDEFHRALLLYDLILGSLERGDAQDALGALTRRSAAPAGYALALEALLRAAGIDCLTIYEDTYAWNLAKLDGSWAHIDAYADDIPDSFGIHFGLTDAAMAREHAWDRQALQLPAGTDARANYFVRERNYDCFVSPEDLSALLRAAVEHRAETLFLYNAGDAPTIQRALDIVLPQVDPTVTATASEQGCYGAARLSYGEAPDLSEEATDAGIMLAAAPVAIAPSSIVPRAASLTLGVGEAASVAGSTLLPAGAQGELSYSSQSSKIATVNESGEVVARAAGSTAIVISVKDRPEVACTVSVTVGKAPTSVSITAARSPLGVGEQLQLGCELNSGAVGEIRFSIPDQQQALATVTSDGLLTPIRPGTVTVTAQAFNGKSDSVSIEILSAPSQVKLSAESIRLGQGDSWTLGYSLDAGAAGKVRFDSTNPDVASVDPDTGVITASSTATGDTYIIASAYGVAASSTRVTVVPAPTSLELDAARTTVGVKEELRLSASIFSSGSAFAGNVCGIKYSSSSASTVAVSADGAITGKKAGSATITATTYNGVKATLKITVKNAPSSVSIVADRTVLGVGEQLQLGYKLPSGAAGGVTFSIPQEQQAIATVTADGLVTPLRPGKLTVSATAFNGKAGKLDLEILAAPSKLSLARGDVRIGLGDSWTLGVSLNEGAAGKVTFRSANPGVADVDPDSGRISAISLGDTYVTASAYGVAEASIHVFVVPAPTGIELAAPRDAIGVKEAVQLSSALTSGGAAFAGDVCTLKYSSSSASVASVDASGVVTGKKAGTATITATACDGSVRASCKITVKKAPTSVTITAERSSMGVGEAMQLGCALNSGAAGGVTFSIPAEQQSFATVSPDGTVVALRPGSVTVTAQTFNYSEADKALKNARKSIDIEICRAPSRLTLTAGQVTLGAGDSWTLGCALNEGAAGRVQFESASPEVASINPDTGAIRANAPGEAVVTATAYNGVSARARIVVVAEPAQLELSAPSSTIGVGETVALTAAALAADGPFAGDYCAIKYSTSSSSVATVSADGAVTGKKAGTATITATAYNGVKATLKVTVKKAPTSVSVVADRTVLGVGEQLQLDYKLSSGAAGGVTFSIPENQQGVATVTADGLVTPHSVGKFTVTATAFNGKSGKLDMDVLPAPTEVRITNTHITLGLGDSWTPEFSLDRGSAGKVTFESDNPDVASVDPDSGTISAVATGEAYITASAYEVAEGTIRVIVVEAPTAVELSAQRDAIGVKETLQLTALPMTGDAPFAGDVCAIKYSSSSASVASVDEDGLVTGKKAGTATITATAYNKVKATFKITVRKAPTSVDIVADRTVLGVGEQLQLDCKLSSGSAGEVSFSIPEAQQHVATVTDDGLLTPHSVGRFTVTVSAFNGKSDALDFEVRPAPTAVLLPDDRIAIGVGDSWVLPCALNEGAAGKVTFLSTDSDVAAVDPDSGRITAASLGEADITASAYGVAEASIHISVVERPTSVELGAPRTTIGVNESIPLSAELLTDGAPFAGDVCTLKYSSSSATVASVDADGVVTGKKAGTATITATAYDGKTKATLKITVKKAPTGVTITADRTALGVGETLQLACAISSGAAGGVTFSIPDEQEHIASVSEDGLIEALARGNFTVTATTFNGKSDSLDFEVLRAPTGIAITSAPEVLGVGATGQVEARLSDDGSAGKLYYRIAEESGVATIDESGAIRALEPGLAEIEVYTYRSGVSDTALLEVRPAPESLELPEKSIDLGVGDSYAIEPELDEGSAASFSYSSSNKSYATVDAAGVVAGVKVGTATITVKTHNGLSAKLTVNVKAKPTSIQASPAELTLGVDETAVLGAVLSKSSATTLRFESENPALAIVDGDGTVTALAEGRVNINIYTHNNLKASCALTIVPAPRSAVIDIPDEMGVGQKAPLRCALEPGNSHTVPVWEIVSGDAVELRDEYLVAVREGTVRLRLSTHLASVYDEQEITVKPAPKEIYFEEDEVYVFIDEPDYLRPSFEPEDCATELSYEIATPGSFEIDEDGLITPIRRGSSVVSVSTHNGLKASVTVTVVDPFFPETVSLNPEPPEQLLLGQTYEPEVVVFPETSVAEMRWSSSNDAIATVDTYTGAVEGVSPGRATITGVSERNPKITLSYTVIVLSNTRCLTMPTHRTGTGEINSTLQQIRNVQDSAHLELQDLAARGYISESEMNTRMGYVDRAFQMYLFPWMTESKVLYWKAANSEGGQKDFKPGTVYYGIPYTQTNRLSYPSGAISSGHYEDSGKGYYLLQTEKFDSRKYPGSDCSSFCSMAVWGFTGSHRADNTTAIAKASYYKTPSGDQAWQDLRPGDLICAGGHHVVMFLYYVNKAKTQFVVIEQGGGGNDLYCNTVSTSIRDQDYYKTRDYKIRRVSTLDMTWRDRVEE